MSNRCMRSVTFLTLVFFAVSLVVMFFVASGVAAERARKVGPRMPRVAPGSRAGATAGQRSVSARHPYQRIRTGMIPQSAPVMPVVTVNPYADEPSRLRAAGLLHGPMPLHGMGTMAIAASGCSFDIECEDGTPCTNDICDIAAGEPSGSGTCLHEVLPDTGNGDVNGGGCDDGIGCNGTEACLGSVVHTCVGSCVGGDPATVGLPCTRATDCLGAGVCATKTCASDGGPNAGTACTDSLACGSTVGVCQTGTPVDCGPNEVCDETGFGTATCVARCTSAADCDDGLTCNGVEVCEPSGLCVSPGNPCGSENAVCLEKKCLSGGPGITNTACETFLDCTPNNPNSCGMDGPYCFFGRCCDSDGVLLRNRPFANCDPRSWYASDKGSVPPGTIPNCPVYGGGIGTRLSDTQEFFASVGPVSLSPALNALSNTPLRKLGDDYDANGVGGTGGFIALERFRFVGGVTDAENAHIAFEFYDANGTFVEDVVFPAGVNTGSVQSVNVLGLRPALTIPSKGFVVGHLLPAFGTPTSRGELFWLSTDTTDQGTNDPAVLYVTGDLGAPAAVANFLGVCSGGPDDGLACSTVGGTASCAGAGLCTAVPGVLAFELVGPKREDGPVGGCCDAVTGTCNELLVWECAARNGHFLGEGIACASCSADSASPGGSCRTCSDTGVTCRGGSGCPTGTCSLNDSRCRVCDDALTPCSSDADCKGIGGGLCGAGSCQLNAACQTGACCQPATGMCLGAQTSATCAALGDAFQGLGTDCDPDCCVQPDRPGADHCEDAIANVAEIPASPVCQGGINDGATCMSPSDCGGNPCERSVRITITGDNATASSTFGDEDSCFPAQDALGGELGWFEKIAIVDPVAPGRETLDTIGCGFMLLDLCCTDPVKIPAYRFIYDQCPCGDPISTKRDPRDPNSVTGDARGAPFCDDDNVWQQFGPLVEGTYYYPVYSTLGGDFGPYQIHVRVDACPDAVCCVGSDCRIVNVLECQAAGGTFLAPPSRFVPETVCSGQCAVGSCCTGPGLCIDNQDPNYATQIDVTQSWCETVPSGTYHGGLRCLGGICAGGTQVKQSCQSDAGCPGSVCVGDALQLTQPTPCPVCEILGPNNCQPNDDSLIQRASDLAMPGGGIHVADDFIPLSDTITSVCVWGSYEKPDGVGGAVDCGASNSILDTFRVRVYASDSSGLPDTSAIIGQVFVPRTFVIKEPLPQSANELLGRSTLWAFRLDISETPIVGLEPSGNTCYWLEVTNTLDGECFWNWQTVDFANNDYSAVGVAGAYGSSSARNGDMAFCLSTDFLPGACGTPTGYCCACDGTCVDKTLRECTNEGSRWRVEDSCATTACDLGPPANDLCEPVASLVTASIPVGTTRFDNTCSNADGVNPTCSELGSVAQISGDIWYTFIAPENGTVIFSTCPSGVSSSGGLDTIIAVYHDDKNPTQCRCPSDVADQFSMAQWIVEPPHDAGGCGTATAADENCDGILNGSGGYISGSASAGDCFLIRVGGFAGPSGEGTGTISAIMTQTFTVFPPVVDTSRAGDHGQRYLEISAPGNLGEQVIRVKPLSTPGFSGGAGVLYVGMPFDAPDPIATDAGRMFAAAQLGCDPVAADFGGFASIAVYGAEVVPSEKLSVAQYEIQRADSTCPNLTTNESCWSEAVIVTQGLFGDVVEPFFSPTEPVQPDFMDISMYVSKFLVRSAALSKAELQLVKNIPRPDVSVNTLDINFAVNAFLGTRTFATSPTITGPCTCPASVTCGAVTCAVDSDCPGDQLCDTLGTQAGRLCGDLTTPCTSVGDCVGHGSGGCNFGYCVDRCGRCQP